MTIKRTSCHILLLALLLGLVSCQTGPRIVTVQKAVARDLVPSDNGWVENEEYVQPSTYSASVVTRGGGFKLPNDGENFQGTDRGIAKTKPAVTPARNIEFSQLLLEFQPGEQKSDDNMRMHHEPAMSKDFHFDRVPEEDDNVEVEGWIIATHKENDNDFHIILATDPGIIDEASPDRWKLMNVEVSGLPPKGTTGRESLVTTREEFKSVFLPAVPDSATKNYTYVKPIHVRIVGSIFFDVDHAPGAVGPDQFKPMTSWEIHPMTSLEFLNN